MLAKQVWNLLQHQDSTTFRILKAKYFPRGELMNAGVGFKPSFLWRSLTAARELVQRGIAWRVGDGMTINKSQDRWIGIENPQQPTEVKNEELKDVRVEVLIDKSNGIWDEAMVTDNFNPQEAKQILAIPLSSNPPRDKRVWKFTNHGFFSVKTAYHLAVSMYSNIHSSRPATSTPPNEWKKIWKIKVTPRVRMFLWRLCACAIPTKVNLCRRGFKVDPICSLCGEEPESVDHLFMNCRVVHNVRYTCSLRIDMRQEPHGHFRDLLWQRILDYPKDYVELLATTT